MKIELYDGKYTYCVNDDGTDAHALRYGKRWRDLVGDNFVYSMALEMDAQAERIAELEQAILNIGKQNTLCGAENALTEAERLVLKGGK